MSMTGFGRAEMHGDDLSVSAEIRSVNHRFLDIHVRCPAKYASWETRVRGLVRETVARGKVDVFLGVREWGKGGTSVRVNRELLASFLDQARALREEYGLAPELAVRDLLGIPDLFVFEPEGDDPAEERWPLAERALREALARLRGSRAEEGERLREVIRRAMAGLRLLAEEIASLTAENKDLAAARFRERIAQMAGEGGVDPVRLHQEAAILLDRLDITEECVRLRAHLDAAEGMTASPRGAVGKRFDFLLQEIFRELNTAASKSAHAEISARVVTAKTELEKVREQIQNVE
ncbi:MAG: YicC family protein [Deltaproteobacteria bacterium]|nr:YicC family protein [Deltaproteobacteria bacterium]